LGKNEYPYRMRYPDVVHKNAIVTGCSTGIGLATAQRLRDCGWNVIATARKAEDLAMLEREGFRAVPFDAGDPRSTEHAASEILSIFQGHIGALVNNAGFGQVGAMEDLTRSLMDYQFQVNVIGLQDLTNRLIPAMRRDGCGRIVNISSVLGRITIPYLGIYSASKFALEAMSDALRVELHGSGIGVSLIEPGPISTAFGENAARRAASTIQPDSTPHVNFYRKEVERRANLKQKPEIGTLPPEAVAEKIRHALESRHPERRYKVTILAYAGAMLARFAPDSLLDWIARSRMNKSG